jgi:hypothetical protein
MVREVCQGTYQFLTVREGLPGASRPQQQRMLVLICAAVNVTRGIFLICTCQSVEAPFGSAKRRGSQRHRSESPHVAYNDALQYDPG